MKHLLLTAALTFTAATMSCRRIVLPVVPTNVKYASVQCAGKPEPRTVSFTVDDKGKFNYAGASDYQEVCPNDTVDWKGEAADPGAYTLAGIDVTFNQFGNGSPFEPPALTAKMAARKELTRKVKRDAKNGYYKYPVAAAIQMKDGSIDVFVDDPMIIVKGGGK